MIHNNILSTLKEKTEENEEIYSTSFLFFIFYFLKDLRYK